MAMRSLMSEAGSISTQVLPELSYFLESSAGSLATFKIDPANTELWDKYSPERFPVMTWKSVPRDSSGKDTGSIYVLPRTPEGLVKIGYRGIKVRTGNNLLLIFANRFLFSSPISNQHLRALRSPKMASGQCLSRQNNALSFRNPLFMPSNSSFQSFYLSSTVSPSTLRSSAGIQTRWTIHFW
jgi:hypothetical protein